MDGGYPEVDKWFQQGIKWIIYVLQKESKRRKSGVFGGATPSKHLKMSWEEDVSTLIYV